MWSTLFENAKAGDYRALARCISLIENEANGYRELLQALPHAHTQNVIGITGAPGAGKSTLVDALIGELVKDNKKLAILCVDPSSPFNLGALLGDRVRMSEWYNHPGVFIRSLATRGSLGGLHPKIIEITDLLKACMFDYIIVETVGVGQSEVEIAGLADVTIVVVVPEAGDEVQTMKAGLMEIADVFVVNKADRPDADKFVSNLRLMLAPAFQQHTREIPIIKTIASEKRGIDELKQKTLLLLNSTSDNKRKFSLLAERAWQLIQQKRMKDMDKGELKQAIEAALKENNFRLYQFIEKF